MKNEQLYNKTVEILVQAYFNDTLEHGNQCGCAVGNIVAANLGISVQKDHEGCYWFKPLCASSEAAWFALVSPDFLHDGDVTQEEMERQILVTGYTETEIIMIERAFESAPGKYKSEEMMFNGLMAVIDVLDEIHENSDANITTVSKNKFTKTLS